jgi:hypothetical protein
MKNNVNRPYLQNLRSYAPDWLKILVTWINLKRIAIAGLILPGKCFVQIMPNSVNKMGYFPGLRDEIRSYNHDTSMAQMSLAVDGNRVIMLRMMLRHVASLPGGDYAELGTYRGISARLMLRHLHPESELHCFDTFSGFDNKDTGAEKIEVRNRDIDGAFSDTSLKRAEKYILDGKSNNNRVFFHKGFFPDTFKGLEKHTWRFVHLDPDLYAPTLEGLKLFYPRLVPGGVILMHDYYSFFTGVRRAAEEYFGPLGIVVMPMVDKAGTGIVIKPTNDQLFSRSAIDHLDSAAETGLPLESIEMT